MFYIIAKFAHACMHHNEKFMKIQKEKKKKPFVFQLHIIHTMLLDVANKK
jgi:hypothetical protein